jgi:AbiV family abortive infection protein
VPRPTPPIPLNDDLLKLVQAALSNARDLLTDARRLADAGSFPRAHALATLAFEEQGKSQLCTLVLALRSTVEIDPAVFWEDFKDHKMKLGRVLSFDGLFLNELPGSVAEYLKEHASEPYDTHQRKLRGMYVDYQDGALLLPSDITEQETRELIDRVASSLSITALAFAPSQAAALLRALGDTDLTAVLGEMSQAVTSNPEAAAAAMRAFAQRVRGLPEGYIPPAEQDASELSDPGDVTAAMRGLLSEIGVLPGADDEQEA